MCYFWTWVLLRDRAKDLKGSAQQSHLQIQSCQGQMVSQHGYTSMKSVDIHPCPWSLSGGCEGKALHQSWSSFSKQGTEHGRSLGDRSGCIGRPCRNPPRWSEECSLTCCKQCSANYAKLSTSSTRRSFSLISPLHNPL